MKAYWISTVKKPAETAFYDFTKTFTAASDAASFDINVSADTRYKLYLNGNFVCEGPCQGGRGVHYYESAECSRFIVRGENDLTVRVMHIVGNMFQTEYREETPAVWFSASLGYADGTSEHIVSDDSWECAELLYMRAHVCGGMHPTMPPNETVLFGAGEEKLEIRKLYAPRMETKCIDRYGDSEKYILAPRPIPLFTAEKYSPLTAVASGESFAEFDSSEYTTAYVRVSFKAQKGTRLRVVYSECRAFEEKYYDEDGDPHTRTVKTERDCPDGKIFGAYDELVADGGLNEHEFFWFRSFRYIRLEADKPFEAEISAARYVYPFALFASAEGVGSFTCSDRYLSDMWKIGANTVECCTHETFIDCPYYEQGQYSMDGMLESLFALRMSNDVSMPKKFIEDLARGQNHEGLIPAKAPCVFDQLIPSFALFWVMTVREYLRYTADVSFAKKYLGVIDKTLSCFDSFIDGRGLVGETHYWNFIDWVPEWSRNGSINEGRETLTLYSMIYAGALSDAAEICEACGRKALAEEYRERRASVLYAVNTHCFDTEKGMYTDVPGKRMFSRHTTIWAVLSDAVTGDEARSLIERTFAYNDISLTTFAMNYFTFRALEKTGLYEKYAPELFGGWKKMIDLHCTTWCENPDSPRSECHGWSSAPTYEISAMVLGVYPLADGFGKVRIAPVTLPDGFFADGRVPIPDGYIDVSVKRENGAQKLSVSASRELDMEIRVPGRESVRVCGKEYETV